MSLFPFHRSFDLQLLRRTHIARSIMRITLGGPSLRAFQYLGGDHRCTLLLPAPWSEQAASLASSIADPWMAAAHFGFVQGMTAPVRRALTVRAHRPHACEVDFDVMLHEHGVLSTWIQQAPPGTEVRVVDGGRRYTLDERTSWQILAADAAGTPAALAVAESAPATVSTMVYLEDPDEALLSSVTLGSHVTVVPISSPGRNAKPGQPVLATLRSRSWELHPDKVGIAGERRFVRSSGSFLRSAGMPGRAIQAGVYWKAD